MEEALVALVIANTGVSGIADSRIWWARAPRSKPQKPYAVMRRIGNQPDYHMKAASGLHESRVQIDSYGETYESAKSLARALQAAVSGLNDTVSGRRFQGIFIDNERDLSNEEEPGAVKHLFAVSFDITIWHD